MGGSVSSRGRFDRQFNGGIGKSRGRRNSYNRPVLKLRISLRASQKIKKKTGSGETSSLDNPVLRRLRKNSTDSPTVARAPFNLQNSPNSQPPQASTTNNSSSPHSSMSSDSMVIVKYIDNGLTESASYNPYCTISGDDMRQELEEIQEKDHLCWVSYGRVPTEAVAARGSKIRKLTVKRRRKRDFSDTTNGELRFKEVRKRIIDHVDPYEAIKNCNSVQPEPQPYMMFRSQSTDAILGMDTAEPYETPVLSREKTRSTGLLDEVDQEWIDVDVELVDDEDDEGVGWTLGESVMKQLEEDGIYVCDVENPEKPSDKEVVDAWPNLKTKMKRWRSTQSLDEMDKASISLHQ